MHVVSSFQGKHCTSPLSIDEIRDMGSLNRESQYPSQGLVVTRRASLLCLPSFLILPSNQM